MSMARMGHMVRTMVLANFILHWTRHSNTIANGTFTYNFPHLTHIAPVENAKCNIKTHIYLVLSPRGAHEAFTPFLWNCDMDQ